MDKRGQGRDDELVARRDEPNGRMDGRTNLCRHLAGLDNHRGRRGLDTRIASDRYVIL